MKIRTLLLTLVLSLVSLSALAYTAQFHAGAGTVNGQSDFSRSEASDGAGIELPTPTLTSCGAWEFAGWVASGAPYEATDELTQELYRAGTVYHLSSISEEFYAVYKYNTDRYHEIYVNDQMITGSQYVVVNEYRCYVIYPTNNSISGISIQNAYTTWNSGYIDINSSNQLSDAEKRSILYVMTETDASNNYWSWYNSYTNYYLDFRNLRGSATYNANADCEIDRSDWNKFTFTSAATGNRIGFREDYYTFHDGFYILRQQTIFTSNPDCSASNYTVTFNPGTNGTCATASMTEAGYHRGVVLPAATPDTKGSACDALWEFAGWTESGSVLSRDSAVLPIRLFLQGEVYYPTRNETLNAVYRRKSTNWEQVEDPNTLQAGEKVLIAYNNGGTYYVLSSAESAVGYNASVSKAVGEMTSVDDAALVWTLEGTKGAWRLKDSNGKHLDMTRSDYAYSYTYPWSRWSDEFTISGEINFSIRSNHAGKHYLTANATKFSSQAAATSNIHIYRQVTSYSKTPRCENFTVLFNSGEGTFGSGTKKDSTVAVPNVPSATGLALNNASVPTAVAPACDGWKFAGWRVGSGLNATTNAPGLLYKSTETFIPLQDSITLYAVYQQGNGSIYYELVDTKSEITEGGTYVIVSTYNTKAVSYNNSNSQWTGVDVTASANRITSNVTANMQWTYNGTYFYRGTDNNAYRLARNGNTNSAGQVTNASSPFRLQYKSGNTNYYLRWRPSGWFTSYDYFYYDSSTENSEFQIYKQKTDVPHNSWPHCSVFTLVLDACGGKFTGDRDTIHIKETSAGTAISLTGRTPSNSCSTDGWRLAGWVEKRPVQARNSAPVGMYAVNASYHPKQDMDQLYAVYTNDVLWTSYPACGDGIEVVEWTTDGVVIESYALSGTPSLNGKNGSANSDGTYTLSYDVASNPCVPLLIQWGAVSQIVQTPLLVSGYTRTSAVTGAVASCSTCDMVVLNGGTAIVDQTTTIRNLTVYPGGRFNLASGKSFTASSLTMRTNGDELAPAAVIQGTFSCSALNHDRRIDNARYYWMALPYDVTIANVNYADPTANGKNAAYDSEYYLKFYNGVARAADHGTQSTYWTHIADGDGSVQSKTILNAGRGYLIGLPPSAQNATGHKYRTLRFPMTVASWTSETSINKTVAAVGANADEYVQHIGWNMIGNPFLQNYSAVSVSDVACGKLTEYIEDGKWVDPWYTLEEGTTTVPYISVYNPNSNTYTQTEMVGHNIAPFSAAFIQLPAGITGIHFSGTAISRNSAPARRMGLLNEEDNTSRIRIRMYRDYVTEDKFTLVIDDQYSASYEVGADLLKMQNSGKLNIYSHHNGLQQVFDALDYANTDSIPVGYTQPTAGEMVISAETLQKSDDVEYVWLIDNELGNRIDLLTSAYTFTTDAGTFDNRFWISIGKREVPTWIMPAGNNGDSEPYKFIRDGQLFIQRDGKIYNASGVQIR